MKLAVLFTMIIFSTTQERAENQLLPTKLRVTVVDGLGNFVEGATVSIYENEQDYRGSTNAVGIGNTDKKGRVMFKDLKLIGYYIEAKKGDQNNNGEGVLTGELAEGKINKVNTVIE
ncbi:MAG: carboxypeptidase regulatory-like domain-containing protein [Cyclobacteriaceae bacterium]